MNLANVFDPSDICFNPMNSDGYVDFRVQEAVKTMGTEHPKKIDVPGFLNDWIRLCSTYRLNLRWHGFTQTGVQRKETDRLIRQRCEDDCKGIEDEIIGVQETVKLYQQELDVDISGAAQTQIDRLNDLQLRYMKVLGRLK